MEKISFLDYPENEKIMLSKLQLLFDKAYEYGKEYNEKKAFKDPRYTYNDLTTDGFFPYYLSQKIKVLFVGLEHYGIIEKNYIDYMYNTYKSEKCKYSQFHYLMYYIAYAFNHSLPDWHSIPELSGKEFCSPGGVSFAFINISKFSNDTDSSKANKEMINEFATVYSDERISLLSEQIKILDPDVIISMNINDYTKIEYLGKSTFIKCIDGNISIYSYENCNKKIPLLDTYHFSKPGINEIEKIYNPIRKAYGEFKNIA